MSRLQGRRTAQQDRLAQLSEDNAFVDVEAALKRMGGDATLDTTTKQKSTKGNLSFDTVAKSVGAKGGAGGASAARGHGDRALRPAEEALLGGARVPLTANLQDQHKAYMESIRTAADLVEEGSESSSSSSSSDCGSEAEWDTAGGDTGLSNTTVASGVGKGQRTRSNVATTSTAATAPPPPPPRKSRSGSGGGSRNATPQPESVVAVSVRVVKPEAVDNDDGRSDAARSRKRPRGKAEADPVKAENDVADDDEHHSGTHAGNLSPSTPAPSHGEKAEEDGGVMAPLSLLARLNAEACLVEQWRRVMLEHTPQLINGVLSPDPCEPWATSATTETVALHAAGAVDDVTPDFAGTFRRTECVLPYPLLQLYSVCPSYEALTASPVSRRGMEKGTDDFDEAGEVRQQRSLASCVGAVWDDPNLISAAGPSESHRRKAGLSDSRGPCSITKSVTVGGVPISVPLTSRHHHRSAGVRGARVRPRPACFLDFKASDNAATAAGPCEDGVEGVCQHHLCSVCMLPASYRCVRCRVALFCSIDCHVVHDATRCLKFTV